MKIDDFNSVRPFEKSEDCEQRKGLSVWGWAEMQVSLREPQEAWAERKGGQSCKERLVSKVKSYQKTEDQEKSISFC